MAQHQPEFCIPDGCALDLAERLWQHLAILPADLQTTDSKIMYDDERSSHHLDEIGDGNQYVTEGEMHIRGEENQHPPCSREMKYLEYQ